MQYRFVSLVLLLSLISLLPACLGDEDTANTGAAPTHQQAKTRTLLPADSPIASLTCKANRGTLQKAVGIFLAQKKRLPRDIAELEAIGMFDKRLRCPSGGTYRFDQRGAASCSVHRK